MTPRAGKLAAALGTAVFASACGVHGGAPAGDVGATALARGRGSFRAHAGRVHVVAFSPNGDLILSVGAQRPVETDPGAAGWIARVHDLAGSLRFEFRGADIVEAASWSPDGGRVLLLAADGPDDARRPDRPMTARLFDLDGREAARFHHAYSVAVAAFSPVGDRVLTASNDRTAKIWALDGDVVAVLDHPRAVFGAVFSPSGDRIATACRDGNAYVFDLAGDRLETLEGHEGELASIAWSPAGDTIATGGSDGSVRLWSPQGRQRFKLPGHERSVSALEFTSDGARLVTLTTGWKARLWDVATGRLLRELAQQGTSTSGVAAAPTRPLLATATSEGARVWDLSTMTSALFDASHGAASVVRFDATGTCMAAGHEDGFVVWGDPRGGR